MVGEQDPKMLAFVTFYPLYDLRPLQENPLIFINSKSFMSRNTDRICISLPAEMATSLEVVRKEEHRTRSELIREALRRYFHERQLKSSVPDADSSN